MNVSERVSVTFNSREKSENFKEHFTILDTLKIQFTSWTIKYVSTLWDILYFNYNETSFWNRQNILNRKYLQFQQLFLQTPCGKLCKEVLG